MASVNGIEVLADDTGKVRGWKVRYRAGGKPRSKTFLIADGYKFRDAQNFKVSVEHAKRERTYVDPALGKVTLRAYGDQWQKNRALLWTPRTITAVRQIFECHVYPDLGEDTALRDLDATTLKTFRSDLYSKLTPGTCGQLLEVPAGPVGRCRPRRQSWRTQPMCVQVQPASQEQAREPWPSSQRTSPTLDELGRHQKTELPRWWQALVPVGAGTGLRPGELVGLTASKVSLGWKTITVDRQHNGEPPQKYGSVRSVPLDDVTLGGAAGPAGGVPARRRRARVPQPQRGRPEGALPVWHVRAGAAAGRHHPSPHAPLTTPLLRFRPHPSRSQAARGPGQPGPFQPGGHA